MEQRHPTTDNNRNNSQDRQPTAKAAQDHGSLVQSPCYE